MPQAIHISPIDNVVVALHPIAKGTLVEVDGLAVTALEDIPQGHKMAVKPIKNGENVIKYGFPIGHATADAEPGTWMHTHNVHTNLSGEVEYSYNPAPDLAPLPKVEPETFMGFRRKDGRAAIRNEIWIIPTVGCVNDIAKKMVADNQDLVTGTIEGLYTFTHPFGCSQTGHDHAQTRKLLAALVRHPNAAAVLVLHLGCENLQHDQFVEELGEYDHDRVKFLTCQDVDDEFTAARDILKELAAYAGQFKREPIPVSELVVGMKCGGSDGLSGITANRLHAGTQLTSRQPHHRPLLRHDGPAGRLHRPDRGAGDVRRRGLPDGPLHRPRCLRQGRADDQRLQGVLHQPQ